MCVCVGVDVNNVNGCLCAMENLFLTKNSLRKKSESIEVRTACF